MVDLSRYPGDLGDADREDREHGRDDVVDLARYPGGDADREDRDDGRDDVVDLAPGDAGCDAAMGELLETTHGGTGERVVQRLAVPSPIALAGSGLPAEVVAISNCCTSGVLTKPTNAHSIQKKKKKKAWGGSGEVKRRGNAKLAESVRFSRSKKFGAHVRGS